MNTIFTTAIRHIRRSPYQAFTATVAMFLTFLLGGIFGLLSYTSALTLKYFESKPQLTVFFKDTAAEPEAMALKKILEAKSDTLTIKYVSKEDALKIYQEQNKNDPLLLEMVTADILPASLEVSAKDPKTLTDLEPIIKQDDNVEEVVYQKDVVDALITWTRAIRWAGGILAGLLALNSILITITVIGMKIAMRKEELEILNLVGASPGFIRLPFIIEGVFYGIFGALIAWFIIAGLLLWLRPILLGFLGVIPILKLVLTSAVSAPFLLTLFGFGGVLILIGALLGSLGSFIALHRYIKLE